MIILAALFGATLPLFYWLGSVLVISLFAGVATMFSDLFMAHGSEDVTRATELLLKGALSRQFWLAVIGLGVVIPVALILWPAESIAVDVVAALLVLQGLWVYENLWIKAGQAVPLS
jgi:formate-dependent nitrite reductase membrane component NrfD